VDLRAFTLPDVVISDGGLWLLVGVKAGADCDDDSGEESHE